MCDCATTSVTCRVRSQRSTACRIVRRIDSLTRFPADSVAEKPRPEIVVLAHRVVEPADVGRVADGVARIPQADDLIDRAAADAADVGPPVREVRGGAAAEAVVGRDDERGVVPDIPRGLHERPRDDEVPAFDRRRARRDDGEDGHRSARAARDDAGRDPDGDRLLGHVVAHHGAGADDRMRPDRHAVEHLDAGTHPDAIADDHTRRGP